MSINQKTLQNHIDESKNNLVQQFKGKTDLEKILESYITQISEIEDVIFDLLNKRLDIDASEGKQLDNIGSIVNAFRDSFINDDANYRLYIKSVIGLLGSYGTVGATAAANELAGSIQNFVKILTGQNIKITDEYPAAFLAELQTALTFDQRRFFSLLMKAKPAGVAMYLHTFTDNAFILEDINTVGSGPDSEVISATNGFGENGQFTATIAEGYEIEENISDTLEITVGTNATETVTLTPWDGITKRTAAQVASEINSQTTNLVADVTGGKVRITSNIIGSYRPIIDISNIVEHNAAPLFVFEDTSSGGKLASIMVG